MTKKTATRIDMDELGGMLDRARLNGVLRGSPDEPGPRLMAAIIAALEKLERDNPGVLARKPPIALLLADIAKPVRYAIQRMEDGHKLGDIVGARGA